MGLQAVTAKGGVHVHVLQSTGGKVSAWVQQHLQNKSGGKGSSLIRVEKRSDVENLRDLLRVAPNEGTGWYVHLPKTQFTKHWRALVGVLKGLDVNAGGFEVLIETNHYGEFKKVCDALKGVRVNQIYADYVRRNEVSWLLKHLTLKNTVLNFVNRSYCRDAEKLFTLMEEGKPGMSQKDIIELVGVGRGGTDYIIFKMCADKVKSERSLNTLLKNRLLYMETLLEHYGAMGLQRNLVKTVEDFLTIHSLYLGGKVYDRLSVLGDEYNKIKKYDRQIRDILEVPVDRLIHLHQQLTTGGTWYNSGDCLNFLYGYYTGMGYNDK